MHLIDWLSGALERLNGAKDAPADERLDLLYTTLTERLQFEQDEFVEHARPYQTVRSVDERPR